MRIYERLQPLLGDMNPDHIRGNVALSTALGLPELLTPETAGTIGDPETTVCIVNPGPSARTEESLAALNAGVDGNGKPMLIVLANAGYLMLERGLLRADAFVTNHPESAPAKLPGMGDRDLEYLVASMAPAGADPENPSIFELLAEKGRSVRLWHAHVDGGPDFGDGKVSVGTGSGAPVTALALYSAMGYRRFRIYGMDGSSQYAVDLGDSKAMSDYLQGLKDNEMAVRVGRDTFTVTRDFWPQTLEVLKLVEAYPEAVRSLRFSGATANAAIFNTPDGRPNMDFEVLDKPGSPKAFSAPSFPSP